MILSSQQKRKLRSQAHALKPVVMIGQHGLTEAVLNEINIALDTHELIKIRISVEEKAERKKIVEEICQHCQAAFVQLIGHIGVLYRQNTKKNQPSQPSKKTIRRRNQGLE